MFENCKKVEKTINGRNVTFQSVNTTNTGVIYERGDGYVYLVSYYTCVAVYDIAKHAMYRTWYGYTATTAKHVGLFCKYINKKYGIVLNPFDYYEWKESKVNHDFVKKYDYIAPLVRRHIKYRS